MRALALLAAGMLLGGGAGAPARGADAPSKEEPDLFFEHVEVNVVNVEVFVTDKEGRPVSGLEPSDFEVFEDGAPMAITNFYAVAGGQPVAAADEAPQPVPQGRVTTPPPAEPLGPAAAPEPPEDQRLSLVIYIDDYNIRPFNRNRVLRRLREFLNSHLQPGDRAMVVSYDRSLHVRHELSGDPASLNAALIDLETVAGQAVHYDSDRRDLILHIQDAKSVASVMGEVDTFVQSRANDLRVTLTSLKDFVRHLAGVPGRKALIYVSDGLPMSPGEDMFYALQRKFGTTSVLNHATTYDATKNFQELAADANANHVTLYTLDAAGLRVYSSGTVDQEEAGLGTFIDSIQFNNLQSSLELLADQTGGVAVINTNDVGPALDRIAQDFTNFYSLGYSPPHSGDGRFHHIEVKVKRRGVDVRHRAGYRDKSSDAVMTDSTVSTLVFGVEKNPLAVSLRFGEAKARDDGLFEVPVQVRIPLGKLVLVPRNDERVGRLRLYMTAMDRDGDMSPVQQAPLTVSIPENGAEEALAKDYVYQVSLLMRPGLQRIAVGVRDELAAEESFIESTLRVGG